MLDAKPVMTPGTPDEKQDAAGTQGDDEPLSSVEATLYRRGAARINYMSQDRSDLSFAGKEISRGMAKPCAGDMRRFKRALRYLAGSRRVVNLFAWQSPCERIDVYTDSDWAGCSKTRRSTSGGFMMRGTHLLAHWSSQQSTVALSVAEAELNASVKGCCEGLGVVHMLKEMEKNYALFISIDSSAAKGILQRSGCGKVKHLEARQLWMQEAVARKRVKILKIPRAKNPSDAMTHYWTAADGIQHFHQVGLRWR